MTNYEIISGLISLLAIIVSLISIWKAEATSKENAELSKKQLDLEEVQAELNKKLLLQMESDEKSRAIPQIDVEYEREDKNSYFIIINKGYVEAHDIDLEFISNPRPSLIEIKDLIPCQKLKPKSSFKILHIPTREDYAPKYSVKLTWHDSKGQQFTDEKDVYRN